ncbi:hypothetical protein TNIN_411271 [Trichonephila inaurata madagascariensis]|uniref:Uncharacterized protein n=1 Tax=Trichonephila inaurata madagascariensis TaxID=2747483 RepID=A0A8X7BRV7_9ARAC|nr:hypothetical protein TNIN_411271 [Trichonephila inaurata madagascariensis]
MHSFLLSSSCKSNKAELQVCVLPLFGEALLMGLNTASEKVGNTLCVDYREQGIDANSVSSCHCEQRWSSRKISREQNYVSCRWGREIRNLSKYRQSEMTGLN